MKQKNYEKYNSIIIFAIFTFIIEMTLFAKILTTKLPVYAKISSIVIKKNLVSTIVTEEEKELLYKNKKSYINNKSTKYIIEKDNGVLIKKDKEYYQLLLKIKLDKKFKEGDIVEVTIIKKKKTIFKMLKKIWKGG